MNKTIRKQITKAIVLATTIIMGTSSFAAELKPVHKEGKWGFNDTAGKLVVSAKYDGVSNFTDGLAPVSVNNKWGFINDSGQEIIATSYDAVTNLRGGYAPVLKANKWGMIAKNGKQVIETVYDELYYFDTLGSANAKKDGKWGKVDKTGKVVVPFEYNNSEPETKAKPSNAKVIVNGEEIDFDVYQIDGNSYTKLRDIAQILDGSEKQFEVSWNQANKEIDLISNESYTAVGGELEKDSSQKQKLRFNSAAIAKDGQGLELKSYSINNNSYFKMRDITDAFDIDLEWNQKTKTIEINTEAK